MYSREPTLALLGASMLEEKIDMVNTKLPICAPYYNLNQYIIKL